MATYYVDADRPDDSGAGTSWAVAKKTILAAYNAASAGDKIVVKGGKTYTNAGTLTLAKANLEIEGDSAFVLDVSSGAGSGLSIAAAGIKMSNMSRVITAVATGNYLLNVTASGTGVVFTNCGFIGTGAQSAGRTMLIDGTVTFNRCVIAESSSTLFATINNSVTFNNCSVNGNHLSMSINAGTATFKNSVLSDNTGLVINIPITSTATVSLTNCILVGNGHTSPNPSCYNRTADASKLVLTNCVALPSPLATNDATQHIRGPWTDGGGNMGIATGETDPNFLPLFSSGSRPCALSLYVDDGVSIGFFRDLADECDKYGLKVTWVANTIETGAELTSADYDSVVPYVLAGHEIGSHGRRHVDYYSTTYISGAAGDYVNAGTPTAALIDEIATSKSELESGINAALARVGHPQTYVCKTFVAPYNHTGVAVVAAALAAGYTAVRGGIPARNKNNYRDLDTTMLWAAGSAALLTHTDTVRNMCAFLAGLQSLGGFASLVFHNPVTTAGDLTIEESAPLIRVLSESGIPCVTGAEMAEHITGARTSILPAPSSNTGTNYLRAYIAQNPDYRLTPKSPCIGAGVDVGLTTDADGAVVPGAVGYDIGPYSYMPGWTLFDGSTPSLSLSSTAPGKLLEVQEWARSDVTKEEMP